ncbi:MAG: hypothetical protein PHQ58_09245 [Rhodoferax sp.]|uniref:hypothetical protein n=1 Tax=Rhodoferax sp. TaxID=50421 RepID=UPI00262BCB96|nr:hypothetical protein [Rhodoferax sp.]MDD2880611.1 hypothetical protein [Rhodoferax sp.]
MTTSRLETKALRSRGYELEPLLPERWPIALEMLQRSYPLTPTAWWNAGYTRLMAVPPNDDHSPIGVLMHGPRGIAGVSLLFGSRRGLGNTVQNHVNASSWAIEPTDRMQALWMAKQTLSDPKTVYTALTPIPQALRILQRLGFRAVSSQRVLVITPLQVRHKAPMVRILDTNETLQAFKDSLLLRALHDHARLGCLVCAIALPDRLVPLVMRTRRQSRLIPLAEVVYSPSVADITAAIGPLSRFLLRQGVALLQFEAHEDAQIEVSCTRLFSRRFASGPYRPEGIDHLYSELVYLQN